MVFSQATAFVNEVLYQDNLALGAYIAEVEARARRAYLLKAAEDEDPRQDCDIQKRREELVVLSNAELYAQLGAKAKEAYDGTNFGGLVDITQAVHDALTNEAALLEQKAD